MADKNGPEGLIWRHKPPFFILEPFFEMVDNLGMSFKDKVLKVVNGIPKGKTMTYKEVAALSGSPGAFRAVGNILNKNYDPSIPCHRVVRSDGLLGGYNRGRDKKRKLLEKEHAI